MRVIYTVEFEHVSGGTDDVDRVADIAMYQLMDGKSITAGGADPADPERSQKGTYRVASVTIDDTQE